jgi:protein-tyrosine phosphatase
MALPGARAAAPAIDVVREMGGDLSKHRSRMLSVELIHQADMIFTMSQNHARAVTALVPSAAEKVTTLDPQGDIEDPIGGDVSLYQQVAGELRTLIERRLHEKVLL